MLDFTNFKKETLNELRRHIQKININLNDFYRTADLIDTFINTKVRPVEVELKAEVDHYSKQLHKAQENLCIVTETIDYLDQIETTLYDIAEYETIDDIDIKDPDDETGSD